MESAHLHRPVTETFCSHIIDTETVCFHIYSQFVDSLFEVVNVIFFNVLLIGSRHKGYKSVTCELTSCSRTRHVTLLNGGVKRLNDRLCDLYPVP